MPTNQQATGYPVIMPVNQQATGYPVIRPVNQQANGYPVIMPVNQQAWISWISTGCKQASPLTLYIKRSLAMFGHQI